MYTYDEIIASGYLVFGDSLSSMIISDFFKVNYALGRNFDRRNMNMDKLHDIIDFKDLKYVLQENKTEEELYSYANPEIIMIFKYIQQVKEECQEKTTSKRYIKK